MVLAGNVKVIKQVVQYMHNKGSTQTLDWLFQRNAFEERRKVAKTDSKRLLIIRIMMFIVLTLVNILMTPVFYALHLLSVSILNRQQRGISNKVQLPLAYAAFSQKKEMVTLFLSLGVDIDTIDHQGNKVFHYIADLSVDAPDTAIQIFEGMMNEISAKSTIRELLELDRNSSFLTAVEYTANFGAPELLTQILKHPQLMNQVTFVASDNQVKFSDVHDKDEVLTGGCDCDDVQTLSTQECLVDVSKYEAVRMANPTVLSILADRDIASMNENELKIFSQSKVVGQWLVLKCRQMVAGVVLFQICDFLITGLLVYLLSSWFIGTDGVTFRAWRRFEDNNVLLEELTAWSYNTSSIFKEEAFHSYVNKMRLNLQLDWMEDMWQEDPDTVRNLLEATSLGHVLPNAPVQESFTFNALNDTAMDLLYEHALTMPQFTDHIHDLTTYRLYPEILVTFARELITRESELLNGLNNIYNNIDRISPLYKNVTVKHEDQVFVPSSAKRLGNYFDYFTENILCIPLSSTTEEDFLEIPLDLKLTDIQKYIDDSCYYKLFLNTAVHRDGSCDGNNLIDIMKRLNEEPESIGDNFASSCFLIICVYMYLVLDVCERSVFFGRSVLYQVNAIDMVITAFGQLAPGSYFRKQLSIISCVSMIVAFHVNVHVFWNAPEAQQLPGNEYYFYLNFIAIMFIVAIVVRVIMHIHSLRLLPGIGDFVITTFKMSVNLLHFSTIYGIVLVIFAMLFHVLIDDPSCPLKKTRGFETVSDSIFSTFKLTFGDIETEPFFSTAPLQMTYILFVIIVLLLLLNLIIGIMGTTAANVMAEPWKQVLWKVEWLDEATSVEYTIRIMILPFRKLRKYWYSSLKKAGFVVNREPQDKYSVFIECFDCPALKNKIS